MRISGYLVISGIILAILSHDMRFFFGYGLLAACILLALTRYRIRQTSQRKKILQALPAATSPTLMAQGGFALLDERFQAVVQVRARHFQTGTITLPEWEGRYQALLRARQELETSTFREALLRLDEYRTAVASRRLQQRYERKLQALCDETMEAILQRADALMASKQIAD